MRHAAAVLEDADAGLHEPAVHPPAREPHPFLIGLGTGNEDDDLDAASGDARERSAEGTIGQKVRRRDDDAPLRGLDEQLEQDA